MSSYYGYNSTFGGQKQPARVTNPYSWGFNAWPGTSAPARQPAPTAAGVTGSYFPTPGDMAAVGGGGYTPGGGQMFPASTPAPAQPTAPARPDLSHLDYSNDPILGRIRALAEESIHQAQADATAARTRLVIGLGDPDLAAKLGLGGKVQGQAGENTFGTFQELGRQLQRRNTFDITGQMSDKQNLFYSTARQRALGLSGEQYLRDKSQATSAAQSSLADIAARVTQARMAAQTQEMQAEQDAYNRALQAALYGVST